MRGNTWCWTSGWRGGSDTRELMRWLSPPPPPPEKNPMIPSPPSLLKAKGPTSSITRKAGAIPWSIHVLQKGSRGDKPTISIRSDVLIAVQCVFGHLLRGLFRYHGERKQRHVETRCGLRTTGRGWLYRPLQGARLTLATPRTNACRFGALNRVEEPYKLTFNSARVWLGWCVQWHQGMSMTFFPAWAIIVALAWSVYDFGCQATYEGAAPLSLYYWIEPSVWA